MFDSFPMERNLDDSDAWKMYFSKKEHAILYSVSLLSLVSLGGKGGREKAFVYDEWILLLLCGTTELQPVFHSRLCSARTDCGVACYVHIELGS